MNILSIFLITYGVLAIFHILFQMYLGHLEHRKQNHSKFKAFHTGHNPNVTVVVPVYNEDPIILEQCIKSIYDQEYKNLEILVVDDGSTTAKELDEQVYKKYNHGRMRAIMVKDNIGKRGVQKIAFDQATGEIIVTVDSDTILRSKKMITQIVQRFRDPEVGAVTGDVRVENYDKNLLTRLISFRYWTAFHQERAAQSYFNVLMCCSGPFSAYRKEIIETVKEKYVSQRFLGKLCTFGDDRHLTNLVLEEGHKVVFNSSSHVYTYVPETLGTYLKQQVRWNKSFYREMLWTYKSFRKHHWYMMYDLTMQLILPFMLLAALVAMVVQTVVFHDLNHLWKYIAVLVGIALLRAAYGIYRTRNFGFLLFVLYGFMHVLVLIPTRLYALITINRIKWGTR
jgi:hyaluronan synthase